MEEEAGNINGWSKMKEKYELAWPSKPSSCVDGRRWGARQQQRPSDLLLASTFTAFIQADTPNSGCSITAASLCSDVYGCHLHHPE